jgi:hypothetical protein
LGSHSIGTQRNRLQACSKTLNGSYNIRQQTKAFVLQIEELKMVEDNWNLPRLPNNHDRDELTSIGDMTNAFDFSQAPLLSLIEPDGLLGRSLTFRTDSLRLHSYHVSVDYNQATEPISLHCLYGTDFGVPACCQRSKFARTRLSQSYSRSYTCKAGHYLK